MEVYKAIILDYFTQMISTNTRRPYHREKILQVVEGNGFGLYKIVLREDTIYKIGDRIEIKNNSEWLETIQRINYNSLTAGSKIELEHTIRTIINGDAKKFISFYNHSAPISIRLHQLNLLPGIGGKLRDKIIQEREKNEFKDFDDLIGRVSGLYNPQEVIFKRIMDELKDVNLKYPLFVVRN
jgi:putative nucleotide binding protein